MRIAPNPIHRKVIVPWYDSDTVCIIGFVFSIFVFVFGIIGWRLSGHLVEYQAYGWLPKLLTFLSTWVAVSIGYRLTIRYMERHEEDV